MASAATVFLAAWALGGGEARANGRFPAAQHVVVGPGAGAQTIVLRATFGFLVSRDAGASFVDVCEEAIGYGTRNFDPAVALDAHGRLHLGLYHGLARVSADDCDVVRDPMFDQLYVTDLDHSADGATVLAVVNTLTDTSPSRVYRSDDGGETYGALGTGVTGVRFDTLEMAPSDTTRVYLSGVATTNRRVVFYRSDDRGATLREMPALPVATTASGAFIAGVDPSQPDTVYLRVNLYDASAGATALLRTTDGGASWREIARSHGPMLGFALSDDGRVLWYGGPDAADRLQRSDDGGASFHHVGDVQVQCLRYHAGALYVCANWTTDGIALGRSHDGGATIEPLLRFADVRGGPACATGAATAVCGESWQMLRAQFFAPATDPDAGATPGDAGTPSGDAGDAGAPGDATASAADARQGDTDHGGASCGCRVVPSRGRGARGVITALALLASVARARRRRRA